MKPLKRPALAGSAVGGLLGVVYWFVGAVLGLCVVAPATAEQAPQTAASDWAWQLPLGFPEPVVPANNPMTVAKVALGELLFSARNLSVNGKLSCADCHQVKNFFVDNVTTPTGALGDRLPFNTPTLLNSAYSSSFSWIDKGFNELEQQHLGPLTNTAPIELGTGPEQLAKVSREPAIAQATMLAFPENRSSLKKASTKSLTLDEVAAAIASYVRTLIKGESEFDAYLFADNPGALSAQAQAGLQLFTSSRLNCVACHRGFLLSGPTRSVREAFPPSFYQTGLGAVAAGAKGPLAFREKAPVLFRERAPVAFRTPSLRFVTQTAPYMHDGSLVSLDEVIDFYQQAGETGETRALGEKARERMKPFLLSPAERRALLAFLGSL